MKKEMERSREAARLEELEPREKAAELTREEAKGVRGGARSSTCKNNLHQLGIALH